MPTRRASGLRADAVALALLAAAALWAVVSSAATPGSDPGRTSAVLGAAAAAFVAVRLLAVVAAWLAPLALVVLGAAVALVSGTAGVWSAAPLAGPFGYANLTGAAALGVLFSALLLAVLSPPSLRLLLVPVGVAAAGVAVSVLVATQSRTSLACLLLLPVTAATAAVRGRRAAVVVAAGVAAAGVVTTTVLAAAYPPGGFRGALGRLVDATLSDRRVELQHDAVLLTAEHPLLGVGGDRYAEVSPAVRLDPDSPWAHHDLLQTGAESGLPGLLLLLAVLAAAYVRLDGDGLGRWPTVVAATGLTSLVVQSCTDHLTQAPAVPALTAALVGAALRPPRASTSRARGHRGPRSGAATRASSH